MTVRLLRHLLPWAALAWVGLTVALSLLRVFRRTPLSDRLLPYTFGPRGRRATKLWSVRSFREVVGPLADAIGRPLARSVGVHEDLAVRLERTHSPLDPAGFRLRQLGWAVLGLIGGLAMAVLLGLGALPSIAFMGGGAALAFLIVEQNLATQSARWQRRVFLELPVIGEQLAILLSAGYSLGAALVRLSVRSDGACAADLGRVCRRIRHGLSEGDALREWSEIARVPELSRLVPLLALNSETSDLGRMVSDEVRNIRREVHRELLSSVEKRAQKVWIPVTVATLLPGSIFLAIPFIATLNQVTS